MNERQLIAVVLVTAALFGAACRFGQGEDPARSEPANAGAAADIAAADIDGNRRAADTYATAWLHSSALARPGFGTVRFEARDGSELTARIYRATRFDPREGPVWFVMHGASRAVERYIRTAAPAAERHDALAIAIHFPRDVYPRGDDYTLGVTTSGKPDGEALAENRWREPDSYIYSELEYVFDAVRRQFDGQQPGYYLFGHSAGAQFVHRLMTFLPEARVIGAVAANAGWYTLPIADDHGNHTMPYGLHGTPLGHQDLRGFFGARFVVLLGERDTTTAFADDLVRGTAEAMAQGATRLERGRHYFAASQTQARALDAEFGWRLAVVPRAGHDAAQVIDSAAFFLFVPDASPCRASTAADAAGLMITEILADPPHGARGDSNGDGRRDPSEDEFVEILNTGSVPLCLSGWALGDAEHPERHVFPLGLPLEPGQAVVVFGGGVPTGEFRGARARTAAFAGRLNLNNDGDLLTLRDADDRVARQISWGDCGGGPCAAEHWSGELGIAGSIVRRPEPTGQWAAHAEVSGTGFSPGVRADGSAW